MSEAPDPAMRHYGELTMRLSIASQLFTSRMETLLESRGLTVAQFGILNHLARLQGADRQARPLRISDIASAVEVNQPAVTKAVAKFEGMGLVTTEASPDDRRARLVRIAPSGIGLLVELRSLFGPDVRAWSTLWSPEEVDRFNRDLEKLARWLDANRL